MISANETKATADAYSQSESIVRKVERWIGEQSRSQLLVRQWQELEHHLSLRAKSLGIGLDEVIKRRGPEVKEMRETMKRVEALDQLLARAATGILNTPSTCANDALAKIELGLHMRQPASDDEGAWGLVQKGFRELVMTEKNLRG